jgi:polysaccharide export outer membrane protein
MFARRIGRSLATLLGLMLCTSATGCLGRHAVSPSPAASGVPTELQKTTLPDHVIAPPDILILDATTLAPRPPYRIRPLDQLFIRVLRPEKGIQKEDEEKKGIRRGDLVEGKPIENIYGVEPDGKVDLGFDYGSVPVVGHEIDQAKKAITAHLEKRFPPGFNVTVILDKSRALQEIRGQHLVQPDGKVTLGTYGSVYVTGLKLEEAKQAIQQHLSQYLLDPEISIDIDGFNSRVYYVIFDMDGEGMAVQRLASTGNETVIDAIAQAGGLPGTTSRKRIWVARPGPAEAECSQILPVDWAAITAGGSTRTNYQLLPGDRVYVAVDPWIHADNALAKVIAPFERILGFTLLGSSTVRQFVGGAQNQGLGGFGGF